MTDESGGFVTTVDGRFIGRVVGKMKGREDRTGDLCPIVIGHTIDPDPQLATADRPLETDQPQLVGFIKNWREGPFFDTGKQAALTDFWIYKTNKLVIDGVETTLTAEEVAQKWPRRSCEVYPGTYDVDPCSILGPTTPARDLGLLKLNRGGSFSYTSPGDLTVPTPIPTPDQSAGDNKDAQNTAAIGQLPILQELKGLLERLLASVEQPPADAAAAPGAADAGATGGGDPNEMSDEELEQLLSGGEGGDAGATPPPGETPPPDDEESRKGKEKVANDGTGYGQPGGNNTQIRLSRIEKENAELRVKLARQEIQRTFSKARDEKNLDINPDDEALLSDLAALPPDMRTRMIDRTIKLARPLPTRDSYGFEAALHHSRSGDDKKRITSREDSQKVIKLARDKGVLFEQAAAELGFTVGN